MTNNKMIYNDDNSLGIDEKSLNKLDQVFNSYSFDDVMNILTPRMQKQLVNELHNNIHNNSEVNE